MKLSTHLDCDLIAVESDDEVTLLVEITAPAPSSSTQRSAATLQIVLDRSGSMAGDRLEGAKQALLALVDRLEPTDNLGIVTFDDEVQLVVPAGPLTDKAGVKHAIAGIYSGGTTDLSAGYLRGLQEAKRVATDAGATLLLISDGHANAGITDPHTLGKVATEAASERITTSALGFGLGYDEVLLSALAAGGRGNELFAENADTAVALIGGEVDGLLEQVAQAASLRIHVTDPVQQVTLLNDLPCAGLSDGVLVELGSFYGGEDRRLVVKLGIPSIASLGLAQVATLELTHVSLPDLVQHTTTVPVHVNVVPGDVAAGRIPDPTVVSERLYQETQSAKKEASRLMSMGDVAGATHRLHASAASLRQFSASAPDALAAELLAEADVVSALADEATVDVSRASKSASYDQARKSRQRGRASSGVFRLHTAGDVLELAEWELARLEREAPAIHLVRQGGSLSAAAAAEIAEQLASGNPHRAFFARASAFGSDIAIERR
ncbi:MAG: Ca-activated chloride channel family protein [Frankiales bacterium]|nr:Ca-activated chloride channel family protein [Frankiales bacterium]